MPRTLIGGVEGLLIYAQAHFEQGKLTQPNGDHTTRKLREGEGMVPMVLVDLAACAVPFTQLQRNLKLSQNPGWV